MKKWIAGISTVAAFYGVIALALFFTAGGFSKSAYHDTTMPRLIFSLIGIVTFPFLQFRVGKIFDERSMPDVAAGIRNGVGAEFLIILVVILFYSC